jgi:hypothetical protein
MGCRRVAAAGWKADAMASRLWATAVQALVRDADRLTLALDDSPTQRYGPHVQGAGIPHNPTLGPAGSPHVSSRICVVLGLLARHPAWGVIALPRLARLYVRKKDPTGIPAKHRPGFRTKLELAVEFLEWASRSLKLLGKPLWAVVDEAYAKAAFLTPAKTLGFTVVSRLRKDAALRSEPGPPGRPGRRGRPGIYGEHRIELAKRGGQRRGWSTDVFTFYGEATEKRYKTVLVTWRPAGGLIRVVLVKEEDCFSLEIAFRDCKEIAFRDCKEIVGAGQQQVRHVWANVGSFHVCLWTFTLTESWAWGCGHEDQVDRSA